MKRYKRILITTLVCSIVLALTACTTTLRGTYSLKDNLVEQSFTFMEDDKVEMSAFGINIDGEYLIEDGQITITYHLLGLSYDWVKPFRKDGTSIFIDGMEFVKNEN